MLAYKDRPKGKDNNSKGTCNKIEVVISILIEWLIDQQQTKENNKILREHAMRSKSWSQF